MRIISLAGAALALALIATPAAAKPHDPDHTPSGRAKQQDGDHLPPGQARKEDRIDHPDDAPGNSGWAHWCKEHWQDADYSNHGDCVSDKAGDRRDDERDEDDEDGSGGRHSALRITNLDIDRDGTFTLSGHGAEDTVNVSVGGLSGEVVGVGRDEPDSDGRWEVRGRWACSDSDSKHDARVRAFDSDEGTSTTATFPCTAED